MLLFVSCEEHYTPKPRGYFRIDLPKHSYKEFNPNSCPFYYNYASSAKILRDRTKNTEPCWMNIYYPSYESTIHVSYKKINDNIDEYIEDARSLVYKHTVKASDIQEKLVVNDSVNVYGLVYELEGNTASSLQFYLTDSTQHFVRGALYFNSVPNPDSIAPVQAHIREDVLELIESFRWK